MDSILWDEESNNYTRRGSQNGQLDLYREKANRRWMVDEFLKVINELMPNPESILDVGCGYGGTIKELFNQYPSTKFIGIDPGTESIAIAKENIDGKNVEFKVSYSHQLDFSEETFDIINLCMVLQWIPRKYLIRTMAEVDRVLKFGGLIYINEFLPNKPVVSQSNHNKDVYIFKNDYSLFFSTYPWYKEIYRFVIKTEEGEDQQRYTSVIRKFNIEEVYTLKDSVTDIREGSSQDNYPPNW